VPNEESIFTVVLKESEIILLVSALHYLEKRLLFIANMEHSQGRDQEAVARRESASATVQLSDKLCTVGAKEGAR
jgi:hypothetical protein